MKIDEKFLNKLLALGEGQGIEFKEHPAKLDREMVAMANASGGLICCGISDSREVVGTTVNNRILSEIQDVARNCDPVIVPAISTLGSRVIIIEVPEGTEKPYQCSQGFFLRIGPNSQKMRSAEVKQLLSIQNTNFDGRLNFKAALKSSLSRAALLDFCEKAEIPTSLADDQILTSLQSAGAGPKGVRYLTNAGVLLFTEEPSKYIPESYISAVRYQGIDRFSIVDRQEFRGGLISQVESALGFVRRHISVKFTISDKMRRTEVFDYPLVAVREAIINATVHRDYLYNNSCVYINIFSDRIEIENPGGILSGISAEEIEGRSVRRNPIIADVLYRAGYGEKLGSGLTRIAQALRENNNPPFELTSTNFFSLRMLKRVVGTPINQLTLRQQGIVSVLENNQHPLAATEIANQIDVSSTTVVRELGRLVKDKIIERTGVGKATRYLLAKS